MNKHIVQLIRERFHPLVRFCGPQSAGEVEIEGMRGTVYLGELSIWLWPAKGSHNELLSDEQLSDVLSPHLLVRNLLSSGRRRCNVCYVNWTGLKRPTETPCHYYGITSKIPLQRWSMGWLWDGYSVHARARQRNELHVMADYSWWKDIRIDGDGSSRKKRNDSAHCGDNALVPMA